MRFTVRTWGVAVALVVLAAIAAKAIGIDWADLSDLRGVGRYLQRYQTLDFSELPSYAYLLGETFATATWATAIAVLIAILLAPFAAANVNSNAITQRLVRELFNFQRAAPDPILVLMLVPLVGIGPVAGVLAMGFHMVGFVGKLLADSMERLPVGVLEGTTSVGASKLQLVRFAVYPAIQREVMGYALYTLDRNVRIGITLGFVGAGGIGAELRENVGFFAEERVGTIVLLIIAVILAIESTSSQVTKRLS